MGPTSTVGKEDGFSSCHRNIMAGSGVQRVTRRLLRGGYAPNGCGREVAEPQDYDGRAIER